VQLPRDAVLVELRPEALTFATREVLLPGTVVSFGLVMEGRSLPLAAAVTTCLVVGQDRKGLLYHSRLSLDDLSEPDRRLIGLFIAKGRGAPELAPPPQAA
jgi:hypothetical protein